MKAKSFGAVFTRNLGLKMLALLLALVVWFYVVGELHKGTEEEKHLVNSMLSGSVSK